jgi:hypothetical protein
MDSIGLALAVAGAAKQRRIVTREEQNRLKCRDEIYPSAHCSACVNERRCRADAVVNSKEE